MLDEIGQAVEPVGLRNTSHPGLRRLFLEPKERLELSTPRLRSGCSTVELLRPEQRLYQGLQLVQGFAGFLFRRLHLRIERDRNI